MKVFKTKIRNRFEITRYNIFLDKDFQFNFMFKFHLLVNEEHFLTSENTTKQ